MNWFNRIFKKRKSMETTKFLDMMSHMNPVETMMRSEKPRRLAEAGKTEDAIACAMAEGFRMGWEAHQKKMEVSV